MGVTEDAAANLQLWKADPVRMVWDLFGATPDRWQVKALAEFGGTRKSRLSLQACVGPGKSTVLAWAGWHHLLCFGDGQRFPEGAAVSGAGADNLKSGLWKELAVWREASPVLRAAFDLTTESIRSRTHPMLHHLDARTYPKSADSQALGRTLSGLHSPWLIYLLDESGDMPPAVGRAAEQGMSGNPERCVIAMAGNPTSHDGLLFQAAGPQRHLWTVIQITGDPDDADRSPRVDIEWAREQINLYGRENPWVMSALLGLFPPSSINALLGPDEMNAALGKHLREDQYNFSQKRLGIDVARFGDDSTVIFPRQGLAAFPFVVMRNARGPAIAARIIAAKTKWSSEAELIDDTGGWGAGAIDAAQLGGVNLLPINASGSPDDPRYENKRAEMNFRASEWVKRGGALPNSPELVRQACAVTYTFSPRGKFIVEPKEIIKKKLGGKSPDEWDAFCLTFALAEMPASTAILASAAPANIAPDWDPNR